MVFNFVDKNNVGSTIKNDGNTQTKKQPVIGTLFSCVKDAVPETAPAYYFYYVREENKLYAGQGSNKPLKEITTGSGDSTGTPGTSVDLSNYATNDSVTAEIDAVKALIPDIKEYMKTTDVRAALNLKADADSVYDKDTVDRLINEIKSGTVDMDLYVKKEDADKLYAAVDHTHDDVYTKTQTDNQISTAIAQAKLNGGSGGQSVDLSGFLNKTDAETTYLKKADAITSDTVQSMIDGAGHLTNADISGFITKETADATYQPIGNYTDRDTVQSMIDNAGHLKATDLDSIKTDVSNLKQDVSTAKADIAKAKTDITAVEGSVATATAKAEAAKTAADTAKQTAEAAKTKAEQAEAAANSATAKAEAAQNTANSADTKADAAQTTANEAKTKAETNAGEISTIKANVSTMQTTLNDTKATADAAKELAESNKTSLENFVTKDAVKELVKQYMQELSGSGSSGGGGGSSGGTTVTPAKPGELKTLRIPKANDNGICLSSLGIEFTEQQVLDGKLHCYVMPGTKSAIDDYVAKNHPNGLEIPICFDSNDGNEETKAYDKIWDDNHLETPGWICGFLSSTDSEDMYDTLDMMGHTIVSEWTIGVRLDA